jgi:hypothetical protein
MPIRPQIFMYRLVLENCHSINKLKFDALLTLTVQIADSVDPAGDRPFRNFSMPLPKRVLNYYRGKSGRGKTGNY